MPGDDDARWAAGGRGGEPEPLRDIIARFNELLPDGMTAEYDTTPLVGAGLVTALPQPPTTPVDLREALASLYRLLDEQPPTPRLGRVEVGEQAYRWLREHLTTADGDLPIDPASQIWGVPVVVDERLGEWGWRLLDTNGMPIREGCIVGDQIIIIDTQAIRDALKPDLNLEPPSWPLPPYRRGW